MLQLAILCLLWLSSVHSEGSANVHMEETMILEQKDMMMMEDPGMKLKRDSFHLQPSAPCPPFYPNLGIHLPQHTLSRPYGPPTYAKTVSQQMTYAPQHVQFIHQPSYQSYVPKQTVNYIKPVNYQPMLHPMVQAPIVKVPVIAPPKITIEKPAPLYHKQLVQPISYSPPPVYHKPMLLQPIPYPKTVIKPISYGHVQYKNYEVPQITYQKQAVVVKPSCPEPQPISYVKSHRVIHSAPAYEPPPVQYENKMSEIVPSKHIF